MPDADSDSMHPAVRSVSVCYLPAEFWRASATSDAARPYLCRFGTNATRQRAGTLIYFDFVSPARRCYISPHSARVSTSKRRGAGRPCRARIGKYGSSSLKSTRFSLSSPSFFLLPLAAARCIKELFITTPFFCFPARRAARIVKRPATVSHASGSVFFPRRRSTFHRG